jgi:hypothetical protein
MAMVPHSSSTSSTSVTGGEIVLAERPRQEGSSVRGVGVEPPRILIWIGTNMLWLKFMDPQNPGALPFVLDDPAEEREWRSYHGIVGGMAHLLNPALVTANDGLK